MSDLLRRIRPTILAIVRPAGGSLIDVIFGGAHADPAVVDHGGPVRPGSRTVRLRPQRRDLAAALRADPTAPEDELTTWPPPLIRGPAGPADATGTTGEESRILHCAS